MNGSVLLASLMMASGINLSSPDASYFPGSYFDQQAKARLQQQALEQWPGPTRLVELWFSDEFDGHGRLALLLGAPAFHDPQLLAVYRDALGAGSERFRQGAAYGYRDLIGDRLPDVRQPIDDRSAALLVGEITAVENTLRRHALVEVWLQALLASAGATMPGYDGVVLNRAQGDVLHSLDRILEPTDLDLVVQAWQQCHEIEVRIALMRLAEGLALERFVKMPGGTNSAWGPRVYERALDGFAAWIERATGDDCALDPAAIQRAQLAAMGLAWVQDPYDGAACFAWQQVLLNGFETWWPTAARQLYRCGGPYADLTTFQIGTDAARGAREQLLGFYRLRHTSPPSSAAGKTRD